LLLPFGAAALRRSSIELRPAACDATFNQQQGVVILCTDSFTAAEVDLLRSILLSKFHIHSTRVAHCKAKEQYRILLLRSLWLPYRALWARTCRLQCGIDWAAAIPMVRRGAAADDSELCERRVPAAGRALNTKLSQDPEFNETITGVIVVMVAYKSQLDVKKRGFA